MFKKFRHAIHLIAMAICIAQAPGCKGNDNITSVSAIRFEQKIMADSVQLLDVRTPQEFAAGHIKSAININVQSDDFQLTAENKLLKRSTILVYCRSGRRSMKAADILSRIGYKVINLEGGIIDWENEGFPLTQ